MPEYTRIDENYHQITVTERMLYSTAVICTTCGSIMHRRPQALYVNWGGLAPSQGEMAPEIKSIIEDAPRRRDNETKDSSNRLARLNNGEL